MSEKVKEGDNVEFKVGNSIKLVREGTFPDSSVRNWSNEAGLVIGNTYTLAEISASGNIRIKGHICYHDLRLFELATNKQLKTT